MSVDDKVLKFAEFLAETVFIDRRDFVATAAFFETKNSKVGRVFAKRIQCYMDNIDNPDRKKTAYNSEDMKIKYIEQLEQIIRARDWYAEIDA